MFPFNLAGPAFLGFFLIFGVILCFINWWYPRKTGAPSSTAHSHLFFNAPYPLAFLAQGQQHCIAICAFNLIDRGLMTATDNGYINSDAKFSKQVSHPLEHALIHHATTGPINLYSAPKSSMVRTALQHIKNDLEEQGLLHQRQFFTPLKLLLLFILAAVGLGKIAVAMSHGHTNLVFLVMLMIIFALVISLIPGPRVTADGQETLSTLHGLMAQLHARMADLKPGGFTQEATLAAALFGLSALPAEAFPYATAVMPPVVSSSSGGSGSDSSSSCSSSCSSSSGCGGCGS